MAREIEAHAKSAVKAPQGNKRGRPSLAKQDVRIREGDLHVGRRLREARLVMGLSQRALGEHIGVTLQQVQKYENGTNRIGPGRLASAARMLGLPIEYFFEGLGDETSSQTSRTLAHAGEIARLLEPLDSDVRSRIISLVQTLARKSEE